MNNWLDDLRTAVAFLTRLPMPHPMGPMPANFVRAHRMFPLVGAWTVRPLEVRLNVSHMNRWPMSNAWVTELRAIKLTLVMLLAFGVATVNDVP